jgi:hypothetical protein
MREIMSDLPELSDRAAITIAEAMRQMAHSDGAHPQEVALIEQFESSIDDQTAPPDLSAIDTPSSKRPCSRASRSSPSPTAASPRPSAPCSKTMAAASA